MSHVARRSARLIVIAGAVADGTRTPDLSPEAVSVRWQNRPVVTVADRGREFASFLTEPLAGTVVWCYRFEPVDGGTRVVESYEVERPVTRIGWLVIEEVFRAGNRRDELRAGMRTTLERLRVLAEAGTPSPGGA